MPLTLNPRARDLGVPFDGQPGVFNAITDVKGVTVGHCTVTQGDAVRTGVTALFPLGCDASDGVPAAVFAFNGTGEMTGAHQIAEYGGFFGPVLLTGTLGVGTASQACLRWVARQTTDDDVRFTRILPVVAETWDGNLHDAWGFALQPEHVWQALDTAQGGPVAEGNVGGGTGMICHGFKGGIGTASRCFDQCGSQHTVGVLVQANQGLRDDLLIAGLPAGRWIQGSAPELPPETEALGDGSIIVVIATDVPLHPNQLTRVARRATVGVARTGGFGGTLSGEIFLAFSTAAAAGRIVLGTEAASPSTLHPGDALDPLFHATAWAVEEAIVNALVAADTLKGLKGLRIHRLPHAPLQVLMQRRKQMLEALEPAAPAAVAPSPTETRT
ncbi:MAG: P1 family peptidase [Rubrivivax sp.]|nr:P1 family peptidase [Rubrivivax sp.]